MKIKDPHDFRGGLNTDDSPSNLLPEDYTGALNVRTLASEEQHGAGVLETLQGEIELLLGVSAPITYYGEAIGGEFQYVGFEEVQIGTQVWMKKNYDVEYPGSKVYNDDEDNANIYGRLYQHGHVMSSDFCPSGWRVPTEADIDTLLTYLGGAMLAGGKMKEVGESHWTTPNTDAVDSSSFRALPGGKFDALFSLLGTKGLLWLQDEGAYAVSDVAGVINVDVAGEGFLKSIETPNVHSCIYYNGYIYASPRNPYGVDGIARILKVCANDYTETKLIEIRFDSEVSTQSIYYMEQLQRIGVCIYISAYANVGGTPTNLLVQIDTRDDSYKIFKITDIHGLGSAIPITCDDTHIYYGVNQSSGDPDYFITTSIIKYLASDFQNPAWVKFNTSIYGNTGVPIVPVSVTAYLPGDYFAIHAGITDDTYLYLSMLNGAFPVVAGRLLKITKATMVIAGTANIPNCADDISQTAIHVFLGTETSIGDYGSTWAVVAVRKADMNVTELLPHSTEGANQMSYGVQILNIGGVNYLFDLRKNGKINILDITNVDTWTDAGPSDAESKRILTFVYSDAPVVHYILNEIIIDADEIIHVFGWAAVPELIKFHLNPL